MPVTELIQFPVPRFQKLFRGISNFYPIRPMNMIGANLANHEEIVTIGMGLLRYKGGV